MTIFVGPFDISSHEFNAKDADLFFTERFSITRHGNLEIGHETELPKL